MTNGPEDGDARASALVLAVCHEIGNLLAAVRLHAHLVSDEASAVELAHTSVDLDDLCARASPLLAQVRPLLIEPIEAGASLDPEVLLTNLQHALVDQGLRGVSLETEIARNLPNPRADSEVVHHLLLGLVHGAVESVRPSGCVTLRARGVGGGLQIELETEGAADDELAEWKSQPLRGRVLACATAEHILRKLGGGLDVVQKGDSFRVIVRLPAASSG